MNKKLMIIIGLILISTSVFIGCSNSNIDISEIKTITLNFKGNPIDSYSCILVERQNIEESMMLYKKLFTYKSPDVDTWCENITYEIEYNNGKTKRKTFKGIRPVTDLYENIFNSLEVRKQWESIFKIKNDDVKDIKILSRQKKNEVVVNNKEDINKIINSIQTFEENRNVKDYDYFVVGEVEFYNQNNEELGNAIIFREDKNTNMLLSELNIHSDLVVSPDDIVSMELEIERGKKIIVEDKAIMQIVLNNYHTGWTNQSIISVHIDLRDDDRTHMYGSFDKNEVPETINNLFN